MSSVFANQYGSRKAIDYRINLISKIQAKTEWEKLPYFASCRSSCRCLVSIAIGRERGKSGQRRAPYFLTGRVLTGDGQYTASATENIPSDPISIGMDKGEKVG